MPTLITTIEDFSPVISYSGSEGKDWTAGNSSSDSSINKYSDSSYTVTQVANASVSFTFFGTGVQLYGADRANHGSYQVTIDSRTYPPANGKVNGTEEVFQIQLFQTVALPNGLHRVTLVNLGTTMLDLDFITWQTPIGQNNELLISSINQDSDSSFKYTPASAWITTPSNIGTFNGGSGHVTSTPGAFVEYTFRVSAAVAIFGPVGPQGAPYSVQLDNGVITNYSTSKQFYQPQTMLFQAGGLDSGAHTVRLRSEAWNNSASTFAIDYSQVFSTPSPTASNLAAGSIVAIVLGILLAFILVAASYLFYRHRRGMESGSGTIFPFRRDGYRPPMYSSQGRPHSHSQPPTPPTASIQLPGSGWPTGGAAPVDSKIINSQVLNPNRIPYVPDRKYRPDLTLVDELTLSSCSEATPGTSSRPTQISLLSLDSTQTSHTPEQGGSRQGVSGGMLPLLHTPGPAPPVYERGRP